VDITGIVAPKAHARKNFLQSPLVRGYTEDLSAACQKFLERGRESGMENYERELIERAVESNFELKKLYAQHQ
jgi:hypothetical protein